MVPATLRHQLKAWMTYNAANIMLGLAFSIELKDTADACQTLGGVEYSEVCKDLMDYAMGISVTLEKTACIILKGYIPNERVQKVAPNMAKYGKRTIKLKGGDSQFEMMECAVNLLQQNTDTINTLKTDKIETKEDLKKWLETQFSGSLYEEKFANICAAAERLLPLAQRAERKKMEAQEKVKKINTCLWNVIESDEPFTVRTHSGDSIVEETMRATVESTWPSTVYVEASSLRFN